MSTTLRKFMIVGGLLLLSCGCVRQPTVNPETTSLTSPQSAELPEITSETEEGFADLVFRLQDHQTAADGSQSIKAVGLHKGRQVGFELVLGPSWKKSKLSKDVPITTSGGTVSYRSTGPDSDAFLQVLDELYHTRAMPKVMAADTTFTGLSLEGNPANLAGGPVRIKLFYEKGGEEQYAELFTNIDLATRKVEVREKDEGYRKQVIQALRGN